MNEKADSNGGRVALVARKFRLGEEPDPLLEWAGRPWAEKWRAIAELRALMPEVTGNPEAPVERVAFKRRLGEPGVDRPRREPRGAGRQGQAGEGVLEREPR